MAQVIDELDEVVDPTVSSLDDPTVLETKQVEQPAKVEDPVEDLPEKYKGKSVKEIIAMHQEAEKLIGRQGSEVGELRRVVDDFIKTQSATTKKTEEETELTEDDFFVNPKEAVAKAVEKHPSVIEAKQASLAMKREAVLGQIAKQFPDYMDTIQDPSFADWIKSSKVRTELYARAETQFDLDSAVELLSTWNERKERTKAVTETSKADREAQLKAADIGTTGGNETVSKKKFRRSDIIKLMQTDPDRYMEMQPEIMAAYAEGRVV